MPGRPFSAHARAGRMALMAPALFGLSAAAHPHCPVPATQEIAEPAPLRSADAGPPKTLAAKDALLHAIGWRLITGNAAFCAATDQRSGLLFEDRAVFGEGPGAPIIIRAIAPGSPASGASLQSGEHLLAVGSAAVADLPFDAARPWQRGFALKDRISSQFGKGNAVRFQTSSGDYAVPGVPACSVRFEVVTSDDRLYADKTRVLIGEDFPGWSWPEDELAAAIAHEAGHIMLDHIALVENAGKARHMRISVEESADRIMPWLLANAGYDPHAATRFIERWQSRAQFRRKRRSVYGQPAERQQKIATEAAYVAGVINSSSESTSDPQSSGADWRTIGFERGPAARPISPPAEPSHTSN